MPSNAAIDIAGSTRQLVKDFVNPAG